MKDEEKKELKEEEEGSEEKALEKNFNEQKEVLHTLQMDVNTIRGSLQKIHDDLTEFKKNLSEIHFVNFLYAFGGSLIAGGFAVVAMGIGAYHWSTSVNLALLTINPNMVSSANLKWILIPLAFAGFFMLLGGLLLIGDALSYALSCGTDRKKCPIDPVNNELTPTKKLLRTNPYLFLCSFLLYIIHNFFLFKLRHGFFIFLSLAASAISFLIVLLKPFV